MTATATTLHRHSLSYQHSSVSGFYTPETGQYGATRGTCRDCGQRILQVCAEGDTLASNRRAFIAEAELDAAYAENAERTPAPKAPALAVGVVLSNGARVLQVREEATYSGPSRVVLALYHDEFVTWVSTQPDTDGYTVWGHYHGQDLQAALEDYRDR